MSIHVEQSEEAKSALEKQKKQATLISVLISAAAIGALTGILALLTIFISSPNPETLISYTPDVIEEEKNVEAKILKNVRTSPQPPAAASAVANVMTVAAPTSLAIPDTDVLTTVESLNFGAADDFGDSFGFAGEGVSFFGGNAQGNRVVFVIDFSASMRGERDKLMREELTKTLGLLEGSGVNFSLVFFSGPVWSPGDKLSFTKTRNPSKHLTGVKYANSGKVATYNKHTRNTDAAAAAILKEINRVGYQPQWIYPSAENIETMVKEIKKTPLSLGTTWHLPLEVALKLDPQPETIVFMTDGAANNATATAKKYGQIAYDKGIKINAIALLEPQAKEGMKILAELSGGEATAVIDGGKAIQNLITGEITER